MATKNVLVHLNLNGNEIQNVLAQKLATAPASPSAGQFYYNTTDNLLYVYNGTAWVNALSQGQTYTEGTGIDISNQNVISVDFNDVVSTSTTVNGKALSGNITLDYSDVGALASTTTINDLTTSDQQAALNSGATTTNIGQIATNTADISTINDKIPSQATSSNQLADKSFVNSSIATNTADYISDNGQPFASVAALEAYSGPVTNNDYAFVVSTDAAGNTVYNRYKYSTATTPAAWAFEYSLNNSSFTSNQWNAINSGITSSLVTQIGTNQSDIADLKRDQVTASNTITFTNKTIDADDNTISDLEVDNFKSGVVRTTVRDSSTADDNSLATEAAIRTAIDSVASSSVHKITATNPALTSTGGVCTWSITNTIGSADVQVSIIEVSTGAEVFCDVIPGASTVTVKYNSTSDISAGAYKAIILG